MVSLKNIIEFYDSCNEADRHNYDQKHRLEFETTLFLMNKYITGSPHILDACAGGGFYSRYLVKRGYKVTAGDLVPKHVGQLEKIKGLNGTFCSSATDLPFEDASFDVVLNMGAYYHIHDENERIQTIKESLRVLKPDGLFFLSYINRNAVFINHLIQAPSKIDECKQVLDDGYNGHFYTSKFREVEHIIRNRFPTIIKISDAGVDGLIYPLATVLDSMTIEQFESYLAYNICVCEEPSISGHSMHGLYIAKKQSLNSTKLELTQII
jgi:SAM-dependent methyltransferase